MDDNYRNIDQRLLQAYVRTIYRVENPPIDIRIGVKNQELDTLLQKYQSENWAFISAWNPRSLLLSKEENMLQHQALLNMIQATNYPCFEGEGIGEDERWTPEKSLLILGISKEEALKIGKYFEQNAILFGQFQQAAQLLFC